MHRDERYQHAKDHVKISHFTEKGFDIHGIVHVGTNDWYELQWYLMMGIEQCVGFEPLSSAFKAAVTKYSEHLKMYPIQIYPYGLGSHEHKATLHVSSGDGQSSSQLLLTPERLSTHANEAPIRDEEIQIKPYWKFVKENKNWFDFRKYDCLVIDVEGMEMAVLDGMGSWLLAFDFINIELSGIPRYIGGIDAQEVVDYLESYGFKQDSPIEDCNDVFFIREGV